MILEVGPWAHGGHCVARHEGQVVFVRHALPGELVRVAVRSRTSKFLRADVVEVLRASPARVEPPCRWAGRCGGCDFQHVSLSEQRSLKGRVVSETLQRIGGITRPVEVEPVPGDDGLGWRTRMRYAVVAGVPGMYAHRSHDLVEIDRCLLAHPGTPDVLSRRWPGAGSVTAVASSEGDLATVVASSERDAAHVGTVVERVRDWTFRVSADGFWQVHPAAATTLVDAVLAGLSPAAGETALDLYAGVGVFAAFLGVAGCTVLAVESSRDAVGHARRNLADLPAVSVVRGSVDKVLARGGLSAVDIVVLDPPRTGAGASVVRRIAELRPRGVAYVACDPAALARDLRTFLDLGYALDSLRAFDLFGMTHHIECVAVLSPGAL